MLASQRVNVNPETPQQPFQDQGSKVEQVGRVMELLISSWLHSFSVAARLGKELSRFFSTEIGKQEGSVEFRLFPKVS